MFRVQILTLLLTSFSVAQVNNIDEYYDLKSKFISKWLKHTTIDRLWTTQDPLVFQAKNQIIIDEAIQAVQQTYNPSGYEFQKVCKVTQQLVSGFNYEFIIEFINVEQQQKLYEIMIYSSLEMEPDQVVSCMPIISSEEFCSTAITESSSSVIPAQKPQSNLFGRITYAPILNGWVDQNLSEFHQFIDRYLDEAILVIDAQLRLESSNHSDSRFFFEQVTEIKKQVTSGTNFMFLLEYVNKMNDTQFHQVIVYSTPGMEDDQVVSTIKISNEYFAQQESNNRDWVVQEEDWKKKFQTSEPISDDSQSSGSSESGSWRSWR